MSFDAAVIETGNGGDLQMLGNDIAVVFGIENWIYLGLFGGNVLQSTVDNVVNQQSFDCWMNELLMPSNKSQQFNSTFENLFNKTEFSSAGRVILENAAKKDLEFLKDIGTYTVDFSIVKLDEATLKIVVQQNSGTQTIIIIKFKKQSNGDFLVLDFTANDFLT